MPRLGVIVASTRPGRAGLPIAKWFVERAKRHGGFDVELLDLSAFALPLLDEPNHPRLKRYEKAHTLAWSEKVDAMDAFVVVTPEYNYAAPPALVNALDYLFHEWAYKAVGFVSYGGISGGLRSVQTAKLIVSTLKMMPIPEGVPIPMFSKLMADGAFTGDASHEQSSAGMLDELVKWTNALATLRPARVALG